jgi:PPOX class probable F420-dependent enzyme
MLSTMKTLDDVVALGRKEQFLAVVSTLRASGTIHSSLVNAGVMPHPVTGEDVLAFVTYGEIKLRNLRARPALTVTFRSGWAWASVEGDAELIGPEDPHPAIDGERFRLLLREVFTAAGGTHSNWAEYDRTMAEQHRVVVLVPPVRIYG